MSLTLLIELTVCCFVLAAGLCHPCAQHFQALYTNTLVLIFGCSLPLLALPFPLGNLG